VFCSRCGVSLAEGAQFCVDCGHTVEGSGPAVATPATIIVCSKCNKAIFPGAHFCSQCGLAAPAQTIVSSGEGGSAAAVGTAYETVQWQGRRSWSWRKIASWTLVLAIAGAIAGLVTTDNALAPQLKSFLTTAHAETITDGSIAIKPHGFATYRLTVPEGAIDVSVSGRFEASGRAENNVQVLLLTDSEFAVWQSGYATSPYYDSGSVAKAEMQAVLPSNAGEYYLVFSNKPSRLEKTVHVAAGLRYDTWLPDSLITLKQKVWGWFE
jgi:Double zinc ribbon